MKRFLLVILVLLFYFGCKSDGAKENLSSILREYKPKTQIFKADVDSIVEFKGDKGTILKIDPSVLQHQDGSDVKGDIELRLLELTSKEDLLRANAQTISNDRWLISGGAYNIQIFSENKELKVTDGKSIEVNFPKMASEEMQLFNGNRDLEGNINWELSNQILKNRRYPVVIRRDSSFMRFNRQFAIDMPKDTLVYSVLKEKHTINDVQEKYPELDSLRIKNDTILGIRFLRIPSEVLPNDSLIDNESLYDASVGRFLNSDPTMDLINDFYETISVSKLGWINVDRFYPKILERVRLELVSDIEMDYAQLYAADVENNTLLNLTEDEDGEVYFSAPKGKRFAIIAFGIKDEQTYGCKKVVRIESNTKHQMKYKKTDRTKMETLFNLN